MDEKTVKCAIAHFNKKIIDYQMFVNKEIRNQDEQIKSAENYLINTLDSQSKRIDEFINQGGAGVSKEYVDGIIAEAGKTLNYIVENYATKEYVDGNYVSMELLNQIVGVLEENYATKEYVNGLIGEIETVLGGI